ncbi:MAG TPA: aminotransferase class I/II-fold pyridoxal phosphate-dependent enzyme [Rhizobiales bacterium]|nr:aminotransferase class I/II-fold pyridoxal phosphate-dependent enzyme [Hyphomicrobiales bacterium]
MLHLNENITRVKEEGAFAVLDRVLELRAAGHDVINLGIGQPDFTPPRHILEAAARAAIDGPHGYTSPTGIAALREAVADHVAKRCKCPVHPDEVVIVPGGKVTIYFAAALFAAPGAEMLYPDPGFPPYGEAIASVGAKAVPYPIRETHDFGFDADEILDLITPRTSLVIVNSPANPTGGVASMTQLQALADGLARHPHVAILSDEIYSHLAYDGGQSKSLLQFEHLRDRLIMLDGWSKTFAMTGWRLGYGIWPARLVEHVRKLATVDHSCVNGIAQMAGLAALKGPMDEIAGFVNSFDARRKLVVDGLNAIKGISCRMPGGAFYAFPNITGTGMPGAELAGRLLEEAHVAVIAGDSFGKNGEGYVRVSYAARQSDLKAALGRIAKFIG